MKKVKFSKWCCDFETCTWLENETYVWLWAVCNIDTEETEWGTDIEDLIKWCELNGNVKLYFHNLKFDGEFILSYLLSNGFKHVKKVDEEKKTFSTIISDLGQFYGIDIVLDEKHRIKIYDSLKIIPIKIEKIPETFGLNLKKTDLNYTKPRPRGYFPNKNELDYILNDVKIPAQALKIMFDQGLTQMTQASNALQDFKMSIGRKTFDHFFPRLKVEIDQEIRKSYRGGFTYLSPEYSKIEVGKGYVLDVNSLYPSVMKFKKLPISDPIKYKGKYQPDKWYDLYIQHITCKFAIKKNKIPTIQISSKPGVYLRESGKEPVSLYLTNIDLDLFFENYDVYELQYIDGWMFRSGIGIFDNYIDKWYKIKCECKYTNPGMCAIAKLMLNALYGKFGSNPLCKSKCPFLENEVVRYKTDKTPEERKTIYIPMACFITSYAREKTIITSQKIMDYSIKKYGVNKYIYSDTDSIHTTLELEELKNICEIDAYKLGAWKVENPFSKGKFIRQKCYIEQTPEGLKICCAGLPSRCYKDITFDNFKMGLKVNGKLVPKHVKGGIKLEETTYEIKEVTNGFIFR